MQMLIHLDFLGKMKAVSDTDMWYEISQFPPGTNWLALFSLVYKLAPSYFKELTFVRKF